MGTDKDKKRSRSSSPSSSDSSRERRHKKRKEKKHKKDHKKHKHKKRDADIDDAKVAAAKAFLEQHLQQSSMPPAAAAAADGGKKKSKERPAGSLPPGVALLTADDYYERSGEFTAWLQEIRHTYFNELTTQQSHEQFAAFVAAWNSGQLPMRFYQGLAAAPLKRTSHNWQFKAKTQQQAVPATQRGMAAFMDDQQQQRTADRAGVAAERRGWRREQKEALDDLLPRATGGTREARVEARIARREEAKARDTSPDIAHVTGGGSIMGGDDSFQAAKAREAKREQWRANKQVARKEEVAAKVSAAQAAEAAKMAQFRALLAAQGGAITIAKRDKPS